MSEQIPDRRRFLARAGLVGAAIATHAAVSTSNAEKAFASGGCCGGISVVDYGAVGDGTTDDTSAIQDALDAATDTNVCFPSGVYRITDSLSAHIVHLHGEGSGRTILEFENSGDGIVFQNDQEEGKHGGVQCMTIAKTATNGQTAISTPQNDQLYFRWRVRYSFFDIEFRGDVFDVQNDIGYVYDYGWETYIRLGDSWGAYFDHIDAVGTYYPWKDPTTQADQTFLKLDATQTDEGAILSARIENATIHGFKRGIDISDRAFFFISNVDIAHSYEGIIATSASSHTFSEGRISDSLINAQSTGIYLYDRSWTAISNVSISRHWSGYDHGNDWYGIRLDNVNKSWLSSIRVQEDDSETDFSGDAYGLHLTDCGGGIYRGIIAGLGLDYGIYQDNCPQNIFDGVDFQGVAGVGFSFNNNTRDCTIGSHVFSSGWTHYEYNSVDRARINILQKDIDLEAGSPYITMRETDGATDEKYWKTVVAGGVHHRQLLDDSESGVNYELVSRSGDNATQIEWRAAMLYLNGSTSQTKLLQPQADDTYSLGTSSNRWSEVHAATGTIVTSDAELKEGIQESDLGLAFVEALRPVKFRLKSTSTPPDGPQESGSASQRPSRPHYGLIAQDVRSTLSEIGVEDFAGWTLDEASGRQGLRYNEFIAPLIAAVQELSERVRALEGRAT